MPAPDMSAQYNTVLAPNEEAKFLEWAKANNRLKDSYDYDMRGAWKSGAAQAKNGHYPDTYKKPNHPTFSEESQYADPTKLPGGRWETDPVGRMTFVPSATNLTNLSPNELRAYFQQVEPNIVLRLPKGR